MSVMSVMENSSPMITVCWRRLPALRWKPFSGWYSNSRWTVDACRPVASFTRFAARPVGAQHAMSKPMVSNA